MRTLLVCGLVVLATGCVGKGKYTALVEDYEQLTMENKDLSEDLEECEDKRKTMRPDPDRR